MFKVMAYSLRWSHKHPIIMLVPLGISLGYWIGRNTSDSSPSNISMEISTNEDSEFVHNISQEGVNNFLVRRTEQEVQKWYKQRTANFPLDLIKSNTKFEDEKQCTKLPTLYDLTFQNIHWQTLTTQTHSIGYFLSAYYDNRTLVENRPIVRIISVIKLVDVNSVKFCQFWFKDHKKMIRSTVSIIISIDQQKYFRKMSFITYLLGCEIPTEYKSYVPDAVSLVENECDLATNLIKVNYNSPSKNSQKEDFAICMKGLSYPNEDFSVYLVEYIELAKLLGVGKIFVYDYDIHPNMRVVLRYYENLGMVQRIPTTIPGTRPNLYGVINEFVGKFSKIYKHEKNMYEKITHNDCFYMNMHRYKYIGLWDLDEIMIPYKGKNYRELLDGVIEREREEQGSAYVPPSAYQFRWATFSPSFLEPHGLDPAIPSYMYMLQNVYRTTEFHVTKMFVDTERSLAVSWHYQSQCIGECVNKMVDPSEAVMAHFRRTCKDKCKDITKDTNIWSYKDTLIENVNNSLRTLALL